MPDSSDDLEAVHTYPLLGDVMYVRNACFRHQKDPADADAEQPDLYADRQQPTIPPEPTYRRLGERISQTATRDDRADAIRELSHTYVLLFA